MPQCSGGAAFLKARGQIEPSSFELDQVAAGRYDRESQVTVADVGVPELMERVNEYVADYSVAFTKIIGKRGRESDAIVAGSGTLVTAAGRYAILTADHVLEALPDNAEYGLIALNSGTEKRIHRMLINGTNTQKVHFGRASHDQHSPDLGLLLLGCPEVLALKAIKTFYNLDQRKDKMLAAPPKIDGRFLVGVAHELTRDLKPEHGFTRVKGFQGICGAGVATGERTEGAHDYLQFEAKYDDSYQGPNSYQGFSGGGLWQVEIADVNGSIVFKRANLSGVAFYESALINNLRTIYCHGRKSIYGLVTEGLHAGG